MLTRDLYIAALEKRASIPDNQEDAIYDFRSNSGETRDELHSMFSKAESTQSENGKLVNKLFTGKHKQESGSPLLKVARAAFNYAAARTPFLKTASVEYREVAFRAFVEETMNIEKKAAIMPGSQVAHALDAARKVPKTTGGAATKFMGQLNKASLPKPPTQMAAGSVVQPLPARRPNFQPTLPGVR